MFTGSVKIYISALRTHADNLASLENIPLLGVGSLEMKNSLNWLLFNMVSGETTSNAVWK